MIPQFSEILMPQLLKNQTGIFALIMYFWILGI